MNWEIEAIDDGRKYIIRRSDRRVVAVFVFLAKPDVYEGDLPRLFASAEAMLTVCRKLPELFPDECTSGERDNIIHEAESIVDFIDGND